MKKVDKRNSVISLMVCAILSIPMFMPLSGHAIQVKNVSEIEYAPLDVVHKGHFLKNNKKKSYSKIVRSYKQLQQLKKYVQKNFVKKKKYLKQLNTYTKSEFKKDKQALVFTANVVDSANKYELFRVNMRNNKVLITIDQEEKTTNEAVVGKSIDKSYTYMLLMDKKDIKGAEKVKVKYNVISDFEPPHHEVVKYDTSSHRECQLLVDDIDLTAAGHYARINPEMRCAEIPLVAVLEVLGATVEWESDNTANITYLGEKYILNKQNKTFLHEDGYNALPPPLCNNHTSYFEVINGETIVDGCSMMLILGNDRRNVIEDFDNNIVRVGQY